MLGEIRMCARYATGLRGFFRETLTLDQSRLRLALSMERREHTLLDTLRRGVWQNPNSPYLPLFRHAGLEWGDLETLVYREGTDRALSTLLNAGVYVTLDEFKGKRPISRPGLEYPVSHTDFDSPLLTAHFEGKTGGSSGTRRRLLIDLELIDQDSSAHFVFLDSFGVVGRPSGVWRMVLPTNSGLKKALMNAKIGIGVDRWFSQLPIRWSPSEFKFAAFTVFSLIVARISGRQFPYPEHVPPDQVGLIAEWLATMTAAGTPAYFDSAASAAVRICAHAIENGLDIRDAVFRTGSEPLTPARAAMIEQAGVRVAAHYATSETGPIGMACAEGQVHDDVHVLSGKMAVIHSDNPSVVAERSTVLHLSTIAPHCPKLMINVDTGDSGDIAFRSCRCGFGKLGYTQHISRIRSQEKLTSEGLHLSAADLLHLVEVSLPGAFGGAPIDYQLVEDEQNGLSRVRIVISPRRGPLDAALVVATVLAAIHATGKSGEISAARFKAAGTFSVLRREPFQTPAGKVMPLFVMRES